MTKYIGLRIKESATQFSVGRTSYKIYPYETFVIKSDGKDKYRVGIRNNFTGSWQTFPDGKKYFDANQRQYDKLINEPKLYEISYTKPPIRV